MTKKITTDDVERIIDYLVDNYNKGLRFHKTHYMEQELGMPSNKIAKILEQIQKGKQILINKYARRVWEIKKVEKLL